MLKTNARNNEVKRFRFNKNAIAHLPTKDQLLFERFGQGSRTDVPYACLHEAFEHQALRFPQAIAAEDHLGTSITYGELNQQANKIAAILSQQGICPGDRVGIFVKRSIPLLAGILCLRR